MNIGSLYKVKKFYWLIFPTKEIAAAATAIAAAAYGAAAAYWSRQMECEVTYFSPDSIIIFLEEDGGYKKVLTSDGKIGWTWFTGFYNDCFEKVSS